MSKRRDERDLDVETDRNKKFKTIDKFFPKKNGNYFSVALSFNYFDGIESD